jgi:glycosyltransferase involved in cell wall biosynthesis
MAQNIIDIVIIGRNEGLLIEKSICSSLSAAEEISKLGYDTPKIIYIDGQSTDNSLDIANKHGIFCKVVEGKPNPALGRHIGFKYCTGKYVFFLDGDMEIYPGWLSSAIQHLEDSEKSTAGVAGYCDWEVYENGSITKLPNHSNVRYSGQEVSNDVGGGFIYRAEVLREVGDFDPTMTRMGEFEMYLRIFASGYKLNYLAIPMSIHRDLKGSMGKNFIRGSLFTKNVFIPGVVARKTPKNKRVASLLLRLYWLYIWHVISIAFILLSLYYAFTGSARMTGAACALIGMLQLFLAHWLYKNKNVKRAAVSLFTINIYIPAFIFGYLFCWPDIGGYYSRRRNVKNDS